MAPFRKECDVTPKMPVTTRWRAVSKTLIRNQCDSATTCFITLCHTSGATTGTHPNKGVPLSHWHIWA